MQTVSQSHEQTFPPFNLLRLLKATLNPKKGESLCILIDLSDPKEVIHLKFLLDAKYQVQKRAYEVFYQGIHEKLDDLELKKCDFFAYQTTGGSNLELPNTVISPEGIELDLKKEIYPKYDIILFITDYSATAPSTAAAKQFGFRGATMHGINETIMKSGLAIDYSEVSRTTENLRKKMTKAASAEIDFELDGKSYHLHIDLGKQEAQKSHGICHEPRDVANLPAGEVYYVPKNAHGEFPMKFEEDPKTIGLMHVENGRVTKVTRLRGDQKLIDEKQKKLETDPSTGILGELGFGTQRYPYAASDIQDEKILGTFHLATGRNDHLFGDVTLDKFKFKKNASHDDILFSPTKTPEIQIKKVALLVNQENLTIIENNKPTDFVLG